jgi:hypothetical protein
MVEDPVQQPQLELTERELALRDKILQKFEVTERQRLPKLRDASWKDLAKITREVNNVICTIQTASIEDTNKLMYCTAMVVTEELGYEVKAPTQAKRKSSKWKIRLEIKIQKLRSDISCLEHLKRRSLRNIRTKEMLVKKYNLETKTIAEVLEELKQRVTATAKKIERYESRIKQYKQNRQFRSNQRRFYQDLVEGVSNIAETPEKGETTEFWSNIWGQPKEHKDADWIRDAELELSGNQMVDLSITTDMVKKQTKKVKNWTAPGEDQVHGYWLKHLTGLHCRIAEQLNTVLQSGKIEKWLTTGRTSLLIKDKEKGPTPSNYRPITCLPTTFKLMTAILAEAIQNYLEENKLIPWEQKGNRRNSRGTKDQLLIDKMILRNARRRKTNLHVAWIDYKKAFDSVPHSWILKSLEMLGVSNNIRRSIEAAMQTWNTTLTANGQVLGDVRIRRGIFQGDSLSPLLFIVAMIPLTTILRKTKKGYKTSKSNEKISHLLYMDDLKLYSRTEAELESLLNTVKIFSDTIEMEFGLEKCATLSIQRGEIKQAQGIELPNKQTIRSLNLEESYKYLGILQADNIKHMQVKRKTTTEYLKRVRKVLKSKLNGGNTIRAINSWAVPVIRYTAGIVDWTQNELDDLDRKTRKAMTINRALHPQSDVDRLYLPRKEGGRGLLQVKQTVEEEKRALNDYIQSSTEDALKTVSEEDLFNVENTKNDYRKQEIKNRRDRWQNKALHGQYLKNIEGKVDTEKNWSWLRNGDLKKETEGFLLAAQDQALRTNAIKAKIDKTINSSKCRLCKEREETVDHLVSACSKIAQTEYKARHNKVATMLHWSLCQKYNLPAADKWWEHKVEKVVQNDDAKILWDFSIQTDKHLAHNIPDITVVERKQVWIIDVSIPGDSRIEQKEMEKITKYQDLRIEVERIWEKRATVVPVVIGALGAIPRDLQKHLETLGLDKISPSQLQKAALLGTANILRKYL